MTAKGRQSQYTREEKVAAVQLVEDGGRSAVSVANEYGVRENTIWKWKAEYATNPEKAFLPKGANEQPADETERLRRRVQELESEVTFLKKVSAYFAKNPR